MSRRKEQCAASARVDCDASGADGMVAHNARGVANGLASLRGVSAGHVWQSPYRRKDGPKKSRWEVDGGRLGNGTAIGTPRLVTTIAHRCNCTLYIFILQPPSLPRRRPSSCPVATSLEHPLCSWFRLRSSQAVIRSICAYPEPVFPSSRTCRGWSSSCRFSSSSSGMYLHRSCSLIFQVHCLISQ